MLHINPNNSIIKKAEIQYHKAMLDFVKDRIKLIPSKSTELLNKISDRNKVVQFFNMYIVPSLDIILIGKPSNIRGINAYIYFKLNGEFFDIKSDVEIGMKYAFNYENFVSKDTKPFNAYSLAELLNINTCPYCNRNYTNTVICLADGRKIARPQFDHYFDKGTYPLLSLSFYNLIPSCSICNSSIKGSTPMRLNTHLHPYIDNEIDNFQFSYSYDINVKSGLKIEIRTPSNPKIKDTLDVFAIEEIYNSHTDILYDLLKIKRSFSNRYLDILESNLLQGVIVSRQEMYRIVFGAEYDSDYFINRPFSKFKKDILTELGVV